MRETDMEKKAVRTVRRKKIGDLLAVLVFLLLLPYTCATLTGLRKEAAMETAEFSAGDSYVLWERDNGVWRVPMEEFLTGALAASIPADYDTETLKAQAVILRSMCMNEGSENGILVREESQISCLEEESRKTLWGEEFEENEKRFRQAVKDTQGIVLLYQGETVSPPYFRLSAGKTRSGSEIFGQERTLWCQSVECPHDIEAEDFLQEVRIRREDFEQKLSGVGIKLPEKGAKIVLTRDSAGYVLFVKCDGVQLEGERFRSLFGLSSACFTLKEEKGEVILQTKGIGHGLGFDQYTADLMALNGNDYMELLNYFFKGLTLEKME